MPPRLVRTRHATTQYPHASPRPDRARTAGSGSAAPRANNAPIAELPGRRAKYGARFGTEVDNPSRRTGRDEVAATTRGAPGESPPSAGAGAASQLTRRGTTPATAAESKPTPSPDTTGEPPPPPSSAPVRKASVERNRARRRPARPRLDGREIARGMGPSARSVGSIARRRRSRRRSRRSHAGRRRTSDRVATKQSTRASAKGEK